MNAIDHEQWQVIPEFSDYAISSCGRVKRVVDGYRKRAGHVLAICKPHGYPVVHLCKDGKVFPKRINRLVCAAFNGPSPATNWHAAHNDGVRDNNHFMNLRWASPSSNMQDKFTHGRVPFGDKNGARLHPERLARGVKNGKHTKPECTPRGERHGCARLTEKDVRSIRLDPRSRRAIAAAYGVSKFAIDGVKTGKTWGHVQ